VARSLRNIKDGWAETADRPGIEGQEANGSEAFHYQPNKNIVDDIDYLHKKALSVVQSIIE